MVVKNLDLLESMIYYWKATSEKEKVGEQFISSIFNHEDMKCTYNDDFNEESIQRVLSAISNREIFKPATKAEGRFWNNNMWMLEDLGVTDAMMAPVKTMNVDSIGKEFPNKDIEIVFIPGHMDTYYVGAGKLYINFFKLMMDFNTGDVKIEGEQLDDFVKELLKSEF